ncbi:MAG: hypothetical protein ACJAZO_003757 [Myxococcota bacterium]|jgi:hypothetical protein
MSRLSSVRTGNADERVGVRSVAQGAEVLDSFWVAIVLDIGAVVARQRTVYGCQDGHFIARCLRRSGLCLRTTEQQGSHPD